MNIHIELGFRHLIFVALLCGLIMVSHNFELSLRKGSMLATTVGHITQYLPDRDQFNQTTPGVASSTMTMTYEQVPAAPQPRTLQEIEPFIFNFSASLFETNNGSYHTTVEFPCYPPLPPERMWITNPVILMYQGHMYISAREWWNYQKTSGGEGTASTALFGKVNFYDGKFQAGCHMMRFAVPQSIKVHESILSYGCEDPRLFSWRGRLMWTYNCAGTQPNIFRQQFFSELYFDPDIDLLRNPPFTANGAGVVVRNERPIKLPPPFHKDRIQKNMPPFEHQGKLYIAYTIHPHRVLEVLENGNSKHAHVTHNPIWNKRKISHVHGGTPAVLITKQMSPHTYTPYYLSVCHALKEKVYITYAYKFLPRPPFNITHVSQELPLKKEVSIHYHSTIVAFASGLEIMNVNGVQTAFITYGAADSKSLAWILPLAELEKYFD